MSKTATPFWGRVSVEAWDSCWPWLGPKTDRGYGRLWYRGRHRAAHQVAWELLRGPIPEGLEIDHLCRVRHCANPNHMEAVTHRENCQRATALKTHCPQGHPYDAQNTIRYRGRRLCRVCQSNHKRAYKARQRMKGAVNASHPAI